MLYRAPAFDAVIQSGLTFSNPKAGEWILDFSGGEVKETLDLVKQGFQSLTRTYLQHNFNASGS
jgi:hypothetical protein